MLRKLLLHIFGGILVLFLYQVPIVNAEELSASDRNDFQRIIFAQIKAFKTGDGTGAYVFAAPRVKNLFPNAQSFIAMVKRNYRPVFEPQSFHFGSVTFDLGAPTQHLTVVGPGGMLWVALYGFERQQDNGWKIAGVVLYRHRGVDT